jgi:predicted metal-dependent phosphoesterase TrpH
MNFVKVDLHVHTTASGDSTLDFGSLRKACESRGIGGVAVCDHNAIRGAFEARRECARGGIKVIIGEEVTTSEGEVIGLFLEEKIPGRMSMGETIRAIQGQGGVVYAPHPFDSFRSHVIRRETLLSCADSIQIVEIFNARSWTPAGDIKARAFARSRGLLQGAGSDAHSVEEVGNARVVMEPFEGVDDFLRHLRASRVEGCRTSPLLRILLKLRRSRFLRSG